MTAVITAMARMDTPERLSMHSLPTSPLVRLTVGTRDHRRLEPVYTNYSKTQMHQV